MGGRDEERELHNNCGGGGSLIFIFLFFIYHYQELTTFHASYLHINIDASPPPPPPITPERVILIAKHQSFYFQIFDRYWRLCLLMLLTWQLSMHTIFISLLLIQPKVTTLPLILSSYYSPPSNVMHNCHHMTDGTVLDCLCSVYSVQWSVTWLHWVICFAAFILTLTA